MTLVGLEAGRGSLVALVKVLETLEHRFADQPVEVELGRWIAQSRKGAGLSQEKLCAQTGISKPAIVRVERGDGHVTTLVAAMDALGLSMSLVDVAIETTPPPLPEPTARVFLGDCREHMRDFAQQGLMFDAVVTDPPYHLSPTKRSKTTGFMQQTWDGGDIAFDVETWRAASAVLKPGGYLAAFGGSRTFHRLAVAIEDAGFEIRDTIMWVHSSGFPKSRNLRGENQGRGTALKPAFEPIIIARRPLAETSVAANVIQFGTGAINIDACRVPTDEWIERGRVGRKTATSVAFSGRLPPTLPEAEWRKDRPTSRPGSKGVASYTDANVRAGIRPPTSVKEAVEQWRAENGRWPANLILSDIDESWNRYFYCPKASKADRGSGNNHPTVKPNDLMRYLVRLVTPPGGTVFDPFMGSGSTGIAAIQEGFSFVGCEQQAEYIEIARRRIAKVLPKNGSPLSELQPEEQPAIRNAS